jgi:hypothetical protein
MQKPRRFSRRGFLVNYLVQLSKLTHIGEVTTTKTTETTDVEMLALRKALLVFKL